MNESSLAFLAAAFLALLLPGCVTSPTSVASAVIEEPRLNPYVLKAVEALARDQASLGYSNEAFTRDLVFGNNGVLPASGPPRTMCVAAQLEVLVEALNLYAKDTGDYAPFTFLPKSSWLRLRATDLRGQIWIVSRKTSNGAADAFQHFGMGRVTSFEKLQPGDFVNFNRTNKHGHGVVFLAYLDAQGNELSTYDGTVAGFKYFSSQGTAETGGLGYRYAFFDPMCPKLDAQRKRDCGVIRSKSQRLLNTGYALLPTHWRAESAEKAQHPPNVPVEALLDGKFDATYFTGQTTDD